MTAINDPNNGCAVQNGDQLADLFNMSFEYETSANGGTVQYNGNISTIQWNTNINGSCNPRNLYRFSYDFNNRLTAADYRAWSGAAWIDPSKYTENNITYDLNGNLKTYFRRGAIPGSTIDNLTYAYGDAFRPDRLTNMFDGGDATKGFIYTVGAVNYQYDAKGNLIQDNHKKFSFAYNFMNLPHTIVKLAKGANTITITYSADGEKLSKATTGGQTKSYVSGIEYSGLTLEAIYFAEGRCTPNGGTAFNYDYTIKDHLGNARENFRANGAGLIHLEDMHYYPFGMLMEGMGTNSPVNDYTYNGKELNEDFGLNLYDYGARWYDASASRFTAVDPKANDFTKWSSYSFTFNNPIRFMDPEGLAPEDIIIRAKKNDETNYKERTFQELQSLTDDKLAFASDGETVVVIEQGSGEKTEGTGLIRDLVASDKKVTITNDTKGVTVGENPVNLETNAITLANSPSNASNGVGTGSKVLYSPDTQAHFTKEDGTRQKAEPNAVLAHELIHADNMRTGTREVGKKPLNPDYKSNREEEKTTIRENVIRTQMHQTLRDVGGAPKKR